MKIPTDRLSTLCVRDIMHHDVATVSTHQTMAEASEILATHAISGAPVVDDKGRCVGVLSTTDFMRRERALHADEGRNRWASSELERRSPDGPYQVTAVRSDLVTDWMSAAIQTIRSDAPLMTAANEMCLGHMHRLFVLDDHARPIGVLTTLDLVAAMVAAIEESNHYTRAR